MRVNQMFTMLPSYVKIITKKENKRKWSKVNKRIYFPMQKVKSIFKICFNEDSLTPGFKESRLFTWSKQNGVTNFSWDKDNRTMSSDWQRKVSENIFKFCLYL